MAENPLSTSQGSGTQTTSQNPQTTGQLQSAGQTSDLGHVGSVQNSVPGVQLDNLGPQTLTVTANSQPAPPTTSQLAVAKPPQIHHNINPVLMSFVLATLVAAAILFWWIMKSAKTTTKYS